MPPVSKLLKIALPGLFLLLVFAAFGFYLLTETRQLSGIVRDAESTAPIQGATVAVGALSATTNARGEYSLALSRRPTTLLARADGYLDVQYPVNGGDFFDGTRSLDLALVPNRIGGRVLDAETNQALPNVPLVVGGKTVTTNAQGVFEARRVKSGTSVAVTMPGYQPAAFTYTDQTEFLIVLPPNTVVVSVVDAANQPMPNVQVKADNISALTDGQGRAVLRRVKPGTQVQAVAPGYAQVSAPFNGSEVQLALRPATLDLTVTDAATGKPISNTLIYLGNNIYPTNAQGAFHLDNVPAKGTLTFKAPGYRKLQADVNGLSRREVKLSRFVVKGIHIPFGATPEHVRANIDLVIKTELNAIVIDVKSEKGRLAWDSQVPLAKEIQAPYLKGIELGEVVDRCRANKIYCIARMPVFQDTLLATARPTLAMRFPNGTLFTEEGGSAWTNPTSPQVWDYNIALAKEVVALGFDEIQFDYIRFPGHATALYTGAAATEEGRIAAITGFLARAQKELRPSGVFLSADVFGLTTATDDEQYTGQRLRDLGPYLDYISPMVYPDVWADAAYLLARGLGIPNCEQAIKCPYEVIYNSTKRAAEKTTGALIRPWLQAYSGRGNFGTAQYRQQKKAAEDVGGWGWLFWSGPGIYDPNTFDN